MRKTESWGQVSSSVMTLTDVDKACRKYVYIVRCVSMRVRSVILWVLSPFLPLCLAQVVLGRLLGQRQCWYAICHMLCRRLSASSAQAKLTGVRHALVVLTCSGHAGAVYFPNCTSYSIPARERSSDPEK